MRFSNQTIFLLNFYFKVVYFSSMAACTMYVVFKNVCLAILVITFPGSQWS